ncbi:hypothetical protein QFW77_03275 [Luteimonas sp. RD2P54]|uniref:Uncharacterized protein n=1 Tax=Luteimonas endophytica TaxID=3042023 RepID=A0ABT6J5B5_9GAMM|nr:hypothetical protein [Luteimonas endophytica]MDH5822016.1 hypothetical protein [Luteimonas endophytica]
MANAAGTVLGNVLQALAPGLARQLGPAAQPPAAPGGAGQAGPAGQPVPLQAPQAPASQAAAMAATAQPQAPAAAPAAQLQGGQPAHNQALPAQPAPTSQQAVTQAAAGARGEAVSMPGAPPGQAASTVAAQPAPANPAMTVPTRAEGAMADRGATAVPGAPAANSAAAAPGATQAAAAVALTQVAVPASQSPADARGVTLLAGGEQRAQARVDGVAHGHTVTLAERRPRLSLGLGGLIAALGLRDAAMRERHQAELAQQRLVERIFQWLYWVLAITAYGCLAMAILVLLPVFDANVASSALPAPGPWIGGFATFGLIAGFGAWMLARRLK